MRNAEIVNAAKARTEEDIWKRDMTQMFFEVFMKKLGKIYKEKVKEPID